MTYFTSLNFTNYTLVTGGSILIFLYFILYLKTRNICADWFVAGNEIADHTYVFSLIVRFLSLTIE